MVKVRAGSGLGANVSSANRSQIRNKLIEDNALAHAVDDDSKGYSIASSAALFDYARLTESSDPIAPATNLPAPVELANLGGETFGPPLPSPGTFSINDVTAVEGTSINGSTNFTFTVTRSGGTSGQVSVDWYYEGGTTDDDDIVDLPHSGTLTFANGETSKTITIPVSADGMFEGEEEFYVVLDNATNGASIGDALGRGAIINDDHGIIPPGQIAPLGNEFLVNTTVSGIQAYTSITAMNDGGYVVTWTSYHSGNGDIYMQRYGADGGPLGSETRVNTNTLNDQTQPVITTLSNGSFAIAWASNHGPNSYDVQMRVYNSNGTPSTGEIRINSTDSASQQTPAITALADGGFVITWQSELQDGGGFGIYGQRFASSGAIVGSEFQINTTTAWDQQFSSIASLSNGGFVVTWTSDGLDYRDIRGQIYDSTGAKAGSEFVINPTQEDAGEFSSVTALDGGGFVVTWSAYGPDNGWDIFARVFDNSGHDIRGEFLINSVDGQQYSQQFPSVTALVGGGFLVTWSSNEQDGSDWGVYGQRIDANGEPDGAQFRISQSTIGDQRQDIPLHAVTQLLDGSVVAIWRGNGVGDDSGIFARRFGARQEYWTPEGHDSTVTINEDSVYKLYSTDFGFTDVDNDNFTAIVIGTLPHPGTLTFRGMPVASGDVISVADIDMGQLVFTPIADGYGTPGDSFTFYVRDDSGTNDTDPNPHYIWFDINPVNDAPEGTDANFAVATEQNHIFQLRDFGFSDAVEGNRFSSVRITTIPVDGGLYFDAPGYAEYILPGAIINAADIAAGRFFYHAGASNGTASFTFQV